MKSRKYIFVVVLGTFLLSPSSYGQKDSISLVNIINTLNINYYQSINKSPTQSLNFAKEAYSYFDSIKLNVLKFKVAANFATALFINERYNEALSVIDAIESLEVQDNNKALYFTLRGLIENDLNHISEAEKSYKKALALYLKLGDKDNEFTILNNLGLLYNNIGDYKRSLKLYLDCYDIINDLKVNVDRYKYYMNKGTVSYNLHDFNNAVFSFTSALNEANINADTFRIFRAQEKIAQANIGLNKLDIAIQHYNRALLGYRQLGLKKEECTVLLHLGDVYSLKKDKKIAFNHYVKAQKKASEHAFSQGEDYQASLHMAFYYKEQLLFKKARFFYKKIIDNKDSITNLIVLKDAYKGLYEIEKRNNNPLLSLDYLESYLKYDNRIRERQLISQKEQIQIQYKLRQKEQDIEKLEINISLNELKLKNKQQQFRGLIILSVLTLLVLILILRLYIQNKNTHKLLSLSNEKIKFQNEKLVSINQEIKTQRKELIGLNKIKDQLLSVIAHDVKSPMTDLYNLLFVLRHNFNAIHKDELKKNLAVIESSTSNLLNFLNNILNWIISQSSGIQVKISHFSLMDLVNANLKLIESSTVAKELVVNFSPQKNLNLIKSDSNIVDFALRNILSNAVKFTDKKGHITLHITKPSSNQIEIRIADSGIGFNEDIHILLKEDTKRVPVASGTNTEKGYGIGLSLCKKMLAKIDSQIIYKKNKPSGSVFILQLNLFD